MSSISFVAGNGGRSGVERCGFEFPHLDLRKDFFGSDLLRRSFEKAGGFWSKSSVGHRIGIKRVFHVTAKIRKDKNHDYPWPDDINPNITSGFLSYLSHFKPLPEKPKPVTLPFEKPLIDLEKKIIEASCFSFNSFCVFWKLVSFT